MVMTDKQVQVLKQVPYARQTHSTMTLSHCVSVRTTMICHDIVSLQTAQHRQHQPRALVSLSLLAYAS